MYQFTNKVRTLSPDLIWLTIVQRLSDTRVIKSINGVEYKLVSLSLEAIKYSTISRNVGLAESVSMTQFTNLLEVLQTKTTFNTHNSRHAFNQIGIYRQRSPVFAILLAAGVIEKVATL